MSFHLCTELHVSERDYLLILVGKNKTYGGSCHIYQLYNVKK